MLIRNSFDIAVITEPNILPRSFDIAVITQGNVLPKPIKPMLAIVPATIKHSRMKHSVEHIPHRTQEQVLDALYTHPQSRVPYNNKSTVMPSHVGFLLPDQLIANNTRHTDTPSHLGYLRQPVRSLISVCI